MKLFPIIIGNGFSFNQSIKAIKEIEKNAKSDDDFLNLYNNYTNFYGRLDDHDMQAYYFNKLAKFTDKPDISLWWLYFRTQKFEKAISYIHENYPKNNQTKNVLLASSYFHSEELNKALDYYKKWYDQVLKEGDNNGMSSRDFGRYGQVLVLTGQKEKGLQLIQQQIENNE